MENTANIPDAGSITPCEAGLVEERSTGSVSELEITIPNHTDDEVTIMAEEGEIQSSEEELVVSEQPNIRIILDDIKREYFITWRQARRDRQPSIHLLNDGRLKEWPESDGKVKLTLQPTWVLKDWIKGLQTGDATLEAFNIVVCLDSFRLVPDEIPLKNQIAALCRAIRKVRRDTRIFVCENLPRPYDNSPLGLGARAHNILLKQAAKKIIATKLKRVFPLEMWQHIPQVNEESQAFMFEWFHQDNTLNKQGCAAFRQAMFKELGLVPYYP